MQKPVELSAGTRPRLSPRDLARLILVMFLWALCFPLIATGLSASPPLYFAALRSLAAGIGLLVPAFILRRPLPREKRVWLGLLGAGLSSTSLGFGGMFLAGGLVSPGLAAVIANAQPLIAAAIAYFVLSERLGLRRGAGLLLGFAGIILTALPSLWMRGMDGSADGVGYIFLGASGVAVGNVLLKRLAGRVDLLMATGWQFVLGGVPLLLLAQAVEAPARIVWSPLFIINLLVLSLVGTALAFVLWFSLLHRGDLNRLNTFTFLTPVFALLIGTLFFSERLGWIEMVGILLTLGGVFWMSRS